MTTIEYLLSRAKELNVAIPAGMIMPDIRTVTGVAPLRLTIRNAPAISAGVVGHYLEGAQVVVLDTTGNWVMIGVGRWVLSRYLKAAQS